MTQYQTPNTSGKGNKKSYIMLHHTATWAWSINWVIAHFKNPTSQASAHYVIDEKWNVHKFNTDDDILWHAGKWTREGIVDEMNRYSIGIELIWPLPGFTDKQKVSLKVLVDELLTKYNISEEKIIRHKDYAPKRKVDVNDALWSSVSPTFYDWKTSFFWKQTQEDTEKSLQARKVTEEVSKLRNLTESQENKDKLHDFNNRVKTTYKI